MHAFGIRRVWLVITSGLIVCVCFGRYVVLPVLLNSIIVRVVRLHQKVSKLISFLW